MCSGFLFYVHRHHNGEADITLLPCLADQFNVLQEKIALDLLRRWQSMLKKRVVFASFKA
jgi:hypothetical protein